MQHNNINNFINPKKKGTLILSYYRSGGHFLHDYIMDSIENGIPLNEISSVDDISNSRNNLKYKVGILHSMHPKFYLLDNGVLNQWHVVLLTRQDKIKHFISTYFWKLNVQEDFKMFKHHDTAGEFYKEYIKTHQKTEYNIEYVKCWLLEQLLSYHFKNDYSIDYADLKTVESKNIIWKNNDYSEISLESLFTNHKEIEELLKSFVIR